MDPRLVTIATLQPSSILFKVSNQQPKQDGRVMTADWPYMSFVQRCIIMIMRLSITTTTIRSRMDQITPVLAYSLRVVRVVFHTGTILEQAPLLVLLLGRREEARVRVLYYLSPLAPFLFPAS